MIHLGLATPIEVVELQKEVDTIELRKIPDGAGWAKGSGSQVEDGWINGLKNIRLETGDLQDYPILGQEILAHLDRIDASLIAVTQMLINVMEPGGQLKWHRDSGPYRERWHLVIMTNPFCFWNDAINGCRKFRVGWWGPVPYVGVLHSFTNGGDTERIHLVLDIDRERLA